MFQKHTKVGYTPAVPGIEQKTLVYGENTLMTEFVLKKGAGYLVSGRIRLFIGAE